MRGLAKAAAVGGAAGLAITLAQPGSASADDVLSALTGQPLPLAIRDGRVAQLSVHAVPFTIGSEELAPAIAASLDELAAGAATDCFVTAQAVGHVRPGIPGDGGTLAAHRLARARAETVKSALVRAGLPEGSVASVWDYQFSVREPRVTLWIFQLAKGEACAGTPLPDATVRMAMAVPEHPAIKPAINVPPPSIATASVDQRDPERKFEPAPGIHVPDLASQVRGTALSQAIPAALPGTWPVVPFERSTGQSGVGPDTSSPPAGDVVEMTLQPMTVMAAAPQAGPAAVGTPASTDPPSGASEVATTAEIVFAENSSYFPPGARDELQRLAAALASGQRWEIELQAAVDDKARRRDSPATAQAYNAWLADRRQGRIADWLMQQPDLQPIPIRRSTIDHDPSRRVLIIARPLP